MLELAQNSTAMEKLIYGLKVTGLGIGTVFAVLIFLWFVLSLMQLVYKSKNSSNSAEQEKKTSPVANVPVSVQPIFESDEDDNELVAVIMAAVYAASGAVPGSLRMVSCKKRQKTPWNRK